MNDPESCPRRAMTPTSIDLNRLLRHYAGLEDALRSPYSFVRPHWLPPEASPESPFAGLPNRETARWSEVRLEALKELEALNQSFAKKQFRLLEALKQSFAKKEFSAAVCFIDMVGFTQRACGK